MATCEDLIILGADRAVIVELLRGYAERIDGAYLKREAEAAGRDAAGIGMEAGFSADGGGGFGGGDGGGGCGGGCGGGG